ncbi:PKD domain-containing protein [Pseudoalteromonas sp. 1181_04]|uniref:PKD domain-containing protein n=1 Tax=Pseudoalteromonas sp. 1181_04 TaxID=2604450 RepID=UPI004062B06B
MKVNVFFLLFFIVFLSGCGGSSDTPAKQTTVVNQAPVAVITVAQESIFVVGQEFVFSAAKSHDANKDKLTYQWSLVNSDKQAISLANTTAQNITLAFATKGEYLLTLVVNDGTVNSVVASYDINVEQATAAVVAHAGPDQSVKLGTLIKLSGRSSYVLQGNIHYQWSFIDKPASSIVVLDKINSIESEFIADVMGQYRLRLIVSDDTGQQSTDEVDIEVKPHTENSSPNAAISFIAPQVLMSQTLNLSARDSYDVDGDLLTYLWEVISQPSNSSVELNNYRTVDAEFSADTPGDYEIELTVADPTLASTSTSAIVKVVSGNQVPVANAGPDKIVNTGQSIPLSAIASYDPEQSPLAYQWSLIKKPDDSNLQLITSNQQIIMVELDVDGEYVFSLVVNDGQADSTPSQVRITAKNNQKPIAKIKAATSAYLYQEVTLDGSGSQDPEGADLSYQWVWLSQAGDSELNDAQSQNPSFTPLVGGEYVVQLIVNDGSQSSDPVQLAITAQENLPPVIHLAGDSERATSYGSEVILDASLSKDPEGGALTYSWTLSKPEYSRSILANTTEAITSFTPLTLGTYTASVSVTDDAGNTVVKHILIAVSLHDVSWLGSVSGRLVDALGRGLANVDLFSSEAIIDSLYFSTDDNGYYQAVIGVGVEKKFSIMGFSSPFTSATVVREQQVTTNHFTIDLGTKTALIKQNVRIGLTACEGYSGPTELKLKFNSLDFTLEGGELDQSVSDNQTITIGKTKDFSILAPFLYRVEPDDYPVTWIKNTEKGDYDHKEEWQLDLRANSNDVVEHTFEICDQLTP